MDETVFVLGFSAFSGIGTRRFEQLINEFGSAKKAWNAKSSGLIKILGESVGQKFNIFRKEFDLKKYAEEVEKKQIQFFVPSDEGYPTLLKDLNNVIPTRQPASGEKAGIQQDGSAVLSGMTRAPFILFAKGNINLLKNETTIGIVGTRKVTPYGQEVTEMLTRDLIAHNFTIISGMALGVDGIAHRETLKNNGKTIAVLGSGVDVPLPREHEGLYQQILAQDGLIVSTFSPGESAGIGTFPARNAIIAGLSQGIVVTEGAEKSGALITANYAKKIGRPVFSVPGQITSQLSKGTNNLIKNGAIPIGNAYDIIDHLQTVIPNSFRNLPSRKMLKQVQHDKKRQGDTKDEQRILDLLENGPLHFDEIVRTIGKDSQGVGSVLSLMELKGMVKNGSDGKYSLG